LVERAITELKRAYADWSESGGNKSVKHQTICEGAERVFFVVRGGNDLL